MAQLLDRDRRRAQIIASATVAFARHGYAATSVGQIAEQAGITAPIIYRHFAGKPELYQAVLYDIRDRLAAATEECGDSIRGSVRAADEDPDGFRLLFRHTAREPEFRSWARHSRRAPPRTPRNSWSIASATRHDGGGSPDWSPQSRSRRS